ncbi:helix-turn-helix domain-containing protein [Cedecea davisae]|uniref:helix-turn-helix domain-containing protein n=1 Tax=Cedecea davisae TaxID=158484 RepID=UPI00242DE4EB|nr:transcriptional regulator [Cedecea davisae]
MSNSIGKKIREIRETEGFTRDEFAELTGIPSGTQKYYETGRVESIGSEVLMKITQNMKLKKYTMWLMTGDIAPEIGQISPALSPDGQEGTFSHRKSQKAG